MDRSKKRIAAVLVGILIAFLILVVYLTFFELTQAEKLREDPRNMRNWVDERKFGRGLFLDRNGKSLLSREKGEDGSYQRSVDNPRTYAHIIGYNSKMYGKSALEKAYNSYLLNLKADNPIEKWRDKILQEGEGNNVQLTIDDELQTYAYELMDGRKGAVVALNPQTGEVLAMVSTPSFNVNQLDSQWNELVNDSDNRLYDRAARGLYAPGSVMKPITAMSILLQKKDGPYEDTGKEVINGYSYSNYNGKAYGSITLREALMHSSNLYFVSKSQELDASQMQDTVNAFGMNKAIPFDLTASQSRVQYTEGMDANLKASNSFGQGDCLVSPLNMAMAYAAMGNGGRLMKPYLVKAVYSPSGTVLKRTDSEVLNQLDSAACSTLSSYLRDTAEYNGLDKLVGGPSAGKTGTAETSQKSTHAWYCGYAPADHPSIAVAVVLENCGETGYEAARPLAARIMRLWMQKKQVGRF